MIKPVYNKICAKKKKGEKAFAVLIDPDHDFQPDKTRKVIMKAIKTKADMFLVGGSYFLKNNIDECISLIREITDIPVILFPGNASHISYKADAVLFLSLLSGRNPEYLIGQHVIAAPGLRTSGIEVIPTAYILLDGGRPSTVSYITFTNPIPQDQPELISATVIAGEFLGMDLVYLEAGSGALNPVSAKIIKTVSEVTNQPLIVGGGINSPEKAEEALRAGADIIVVGNKIDEMPDFIEDIAEATRLGGNH
ncbi:MAG TPA: geranylgeranylglyceryl/heptaprenylglyceryl phosphate synthase [Cyclobacteriaceae bacterium]|nr:geranylgeranylglyceryl/heptaprenylglyceryl phosphate synthase [Cyclobacteriaceae bacterium]